MPLDSGEVRSIAALLLGRVGDLIVATSFLKALRTRFPKASIRLVVTPMCRETAAMIPSVDEVCVMPKGFSLLSGRTLALAVKALTPHDLLVDLNPSPSRTSAALGRIWRAGVKAGFAKGRHDAHLEVKAERCAEREHMLDRYGRLGALLGAPCDGAMELRLGPEEEARAEAALGPRRGRRVLVHPGNFKKFDNRWPEENFIALVDALQEDPGLEVFYLAGPGEAVPVGRIAGAQKKPVRVLGPAPLHETAALMLRMDAFICNITGTTHLAAALGVPTFGLYAGYTDQVWRPRGARHGGVVAASWDSCRGIPVEAALAAARSFLAGLAPATPL